MIVPRCSICGKISIRNPCKTCYRKDYNETHTDKPRFTVRCITCNRRSTSTDIKYLIKDYKCMRCR